jgi:negative regulator of flagellin synthesis FlgM
MNVYSIHNKLDPYTQNKIERNGEKPQEQKPASSGSEQDKVNLSEQAQGLMQTQKAVKSSTDVRSEKVADLKARVASGEYQPDSTSTAEKMVKLEEEILNSLV